MLNLREYINNQIGLSLSNEVILYHGTNNNFKVFDLNFFNSGSGDGGWLGYGVYLTNDYEYAESYGDVLECRVKLTKPFRLESSEYSRSPNKLGNLLGVNSSKGITKELAAKGYDSVLLQYDDFIEVCIFNPSQIQILNRYERGDDSVHVNRLRGYV